MGLPDIEAKIDILITKVDTLIAKDALFVKCNYCFDGLIPRSVDHGDVGVGPDIEWITCPFCNGEKIVKFGEVL